MARTVHPHAPQLQTNQESSLHLMGPLAVEYEQITQLEATIASQCRLHFKPVSFNGRLELARMHVQVTQKRQEQLMEHITTVLQLRTGKSALYARQQEFMNSTTETLGEVIDAYENQLLRVAFEILDCIYEQRKVCLLQTGSRILSQTDREEYRMLAQSLKSLFYDVEGKLFDTQYLDN